MKHIYILLTATPSKFGKTIRFVLHNNYNHISLSLDDDLANLYTFARRKNCIPLDGGFVKESLIRFTLGKNIPINTIIYKIPLMEEQYTIAKDLIHNIEKDKDYMYNLYSALSFPIFGGFPTYKAFTCVEFGAYVLKESGFLLEKEPYQYAPEELGEELSPYLVYKGDLACYENYHNKEKTPNYLEKESFCTIAKKSFFVIKNLTYRQFSNMI